MKKKLVIITICVVLQVILLHCFRVIKHQGFHELYILGKSVEEVYAKYDLPGGEPFSKEETIIPTQQNFTIWYEYNVPSLIFGDNEFCIIHFKNGKATKVEFDGAPPGG